LTIPPYIPKTVDVGMMQEEDRIDRRKEVGYISIGTRIKRANTPDEVVELVVRLTL
jgi:hypothetical protein